MQPLATLDDRYELLELVGTCGRCATYRARDAVLERAVTVAVLEDSAGADDAAFVEGARRLARHDSEVEVYDGSDRYLVTRALEVPAAARLAERLAPAPATLAPLSVGGSEVGGVRLGRTRSAVGLAVTSALLLGMTGVLAALGQPGGDGDGMPAVMGVFAPADLDDVAERDLTVARAVLKRAQEASADEAEAEVAPPSTPAPPAPAAPRAVWGQRAARKHTPGPGPATQAERARDQRGGAKDDKHLRDREQDGKTGPTARPARASGKKGPGHGEDATPPRKDENQVGKHAPPPPGKAGKRGGDGPGERPHPPGAKGPGKGARS